MRVMTAEMQTFVDAIRAGADGLSAVQRAFPNNTAPRQKLQKLASNSQVREALHAALQQSNLRPRRITRNCWVPLPNSPEPAQDGQTPRQDDPQSTDETALTPIHDAEGTPKPDWMKDTEWRQHCWELVGILADPDLYAARRLNVAALPAGFSAATYKSFSIERGKQNQLKS